MLVLACLGAAFGLSQFRSKVESVPVVDIGSSLTPSDPEQASGPRNILIIGTDSAKRLEDDDPVTDGRESFGQLADVIMILRIDPGDGTARLLSIPRDSRVEVAPKWNMTKINAAIGAGGDEGPRNLVRTIKKNFGISIDNFVEVDFKSFRDLVEVLGGIPVYFSTPVRDKNSGLYIDQPGCIMLNPAEALAYSRARHFEYQVDGRWKTDPTGDLGRISRQQDFIKRSLRRASDKGIRQPGTALGIVNAGAASVTMDDTLTVGSILDLLREFQTFDPNSLQSTQIPTTSSLRGGISYQEVLWDDAEPLLAEFRTPYGTPLAPANVIVDVTGPKSASEDLVRVADELDAVGFDAESVGASSSKGTSTQLTFGPSGREAALLMLAQLDGDVDVQLDESIRGARVVLRIGSDFGSVRKEAIPLDQLSADLLPTTTSSSSTTTVDDGDSESAETGGESGESSSTTVAGDGTAAGSPSSTTSTTVPGIVPTDPDLAATCR